MYEIGAQFEYKKLSEEIFKDIAHFV